MSIDNPARSSWPDEWIEPWTAHEQPEREFDIGTWLCDCEACQFALTAHAERHPHSLLCLKTGADRIVVTAEYLDEVLRAGLPIESLLYAPDDYVREVFVPVNYWLRRGVRWRSLRCMDDEKLAGRKPFKRKVAIRQPEVARRRARAEAARLAEERPELQQRGA